MSWPFILKHSDFTDEVYIVCPQCTDKALVKGPGLYKENEDTLTYCVCMECGYYQKYQDKNTDLYRNSNNNINSYRIELLDGEVDPFFHFPLWYSIPCLEGTVWAYNLEHLKLIETFIASGDQSRSGLRYKNNSIASRLPKWMSAAKNREILLKCIRELKMK